MPFDFSYDDLKEFDYGGKEGFTRIGDKSAYGQIFVPDSDPTKVIKVQKGPFGVYDREISNQFEAQLSNPEHFEVPKLYETGFIPDNLEGAFYENPYTELRKFDQDTVGRSYMVMDKMDFVDSEMSKLHPSQEEIFNRRKGLADYHLKTGMLHKDLHSGNIKYNPYTEKTVILDHAFADKIKPKTNYLEAYTNLTHGLKAGGHQDIAEIFNATFNNPDLNDEQRIDLLKQGMEVLNMHTAADRPLMLFDDTGGLPRFSASEQSAYQLPGASEFRKQAKVLMEGLNDLEGKVDDVDWTKIDQDIKRRRALSNLGRGQISRPSDIPIVLKFAGDALADGVQKAAQHAKPRALMGAAVGGMSDVIPSAEVIKAAEKGGIRAAGKEYAKEQVGAIPMMAAAGLTAAAVPASLPVLAAAGTGLTLSEAARSANEASRVLTGDSLVSKMRQTIGTEPRSGYATKGAAKNVEEKRLEELERINNPPTITPTKWNSRRPVVKAAIPDLTHRVRLAGDRFNPSRLEFGLTELLLGR